jgi:hypothetical protein
LNLRKILIVVLLVVGGYFAVTRYLYPSWHQVSSAEHNFAIKMPRQPEVGSTSLPAPGNPRMSIYLCNMPERAGVYAVMVTDRLDIGPGDLESLSHAFQRAQRLQLTADRAVEVDGNPGRRMSGTVAGDGQVDVEYFIANQRMYYLMVIRRGNANADPERFFNSFRILKN